MKKRILLLIAAFAIASGPAYAKKPPQLTPMELQALQSREFETSKENLFGAVMTVLQDLGYQVQTADVQTGFITAVSATQNKTNFLMALGGARASGNTKITCFLQAMPNGMTRVRLNFLNSRSMSSAYGQNSQDDKPILDAIAYRNVWEKIDEALFVMGALQAPVPPATVGSAPASSVGTLSLPVTQPASSSGQGATVPPSSPAQTPQP